MSDQHHGSDLATSFLLGAMIRQRHDAQQENDFRTIQAAFMHQGYDVHTAEALTQEYLDTQREQSDAGSAFGSIFNFVMTLVLLALIGRAVVSLFGAVFGG